jgi:hypothetical protein
MSSWRRDPALAGLFRASPNESTPVLLELAAAQAGRRGPADLARQFARDPFVQPGAFDQRALHRLDGFALDAAAAFEAVQLSPVAPLGACSAVAPTSQDRTLSANRGTEVVSDPTNMLALECARRLALAPGADVRLCTSHQVLRAQSVPPGRGFAQHFRMFALAEAGPALPDDRFEAAAIARHLGVFDAVFDAAAALGAALPERRARVLVTPPRAVAAGRVAAAIRAALPRVAVTAEPFETRYYDGLRVLLGARAADGEALSIADVGAFDWVARLASNARLRLVASGCGLQLVAARFVRGPAAG